MMLKKLMLASAAAVALTAAAAADTPAGFYLDAGAGANWLQDFDSELTDGVTTANLEADTGYFFNGSAGYKLDNGLRVEFELAWRSNDYDASIRGVDVGLDGSATSFSQMANLLYDIDVGPGYALSLGGGIGGARIGIEDNTFVDGRDYVFAYQGIAEFEAMVSDNMGLFVGYNYFVGRNVHTSLQPQFVAVGGSDRVNAGDYKAHTAYVGLRVHFSEPEEVVAPPPPPPPPPPAPAKTFIVFFNFDRSDLTPEAQAVIAEAASAFQSTGAVTVAVVGHTDTAGSASYNQALSERRAASVRSGLAAAGVPDSAITTSGRGFSDPLVPTGAGVKEPQNRRATIDLTGSAM